jgi:hypothetical protein
MSQWDSAPRYIALLVYTYWVALEERYQLSQHLFDGALAHQQFKYPVLDGIFRNFDSFPLP